jgi:hypothetical protein
MQDQATQQGADIHSAANAIEGLLGADEPLKKPEAQAEEKTKSEVKRDSSETSDQSDDATPPDAESNDQDDVEDAESEVTEDNPKVEGDDATTLPESIDQLAESLGVPEDALFNLKVRTKIDGKDGIATLGEIVKNYQLDGHITNKSMQLSEAKKAFEAQAQQYNQLMQQRMDEAVGVINMLDDQFKQEYEAINWAELEVNDPAEYAAKKIKFQEKANQIRYAYNNIQGKLEQERQQQQAQQQMAFQQHVAKEAQMLTEKLPEWRKPEVANAEKAELAKYLSNEGFKPEELGIYDHRQLIIARKAMQYDKLMQSKAKIEKKVINLPKIMKPGSPKSKADIAQEERSKKLKTLKKTGNVKDAADLFMGLM